MNINLQNYEECFVRYVDHDLSVDEMVEVNRFIKANPELRHELEAFKMTVLVPDNRIVFSNKDALFRTKPRSGVLVYWKQIALSAAAACLAAMLIVVFGKNELVAFFGNQPASMPVAELNYAQTENGSSDLSVAFPHYKNSFSKRFFSEVSSPAATSNSEAKNKIQETTPGNQNISEQKQNDAITAELLKASGQPEQLFPDEHNDPEASNFSRSSILMEPSAPSSDNLSMLTSYGNEQGNYIPPANNSTEQLQHLANKINQQINQIGSVSANKSGNSPQSNQAHPVHVSIQTKTIKFNHTFNAKSNNLIGNEVLKILQSPNDKQPKK